MHDEREQANVRTALVVDQDVQAAELVRLLLEAEGFTVLCATSAESALEMAPGQQLSLITLDVQLPGMDGWEYLLRIRDSAALATVPVVIVSGQGDANMGLTRGASAVLQKPISRAQLKMSLATLGLHPTPARTHTILVVDDDPKAIEVIAAFLPAPAYTVVRAHGGSEAIRLARQHKPDLILLDLMMPEVNGFEVVAALHGCAETAAIPILVVTAKHITAQDRALLHSGADKMVGIVPKAGFDSARFMTEVRSALLQR